jgi:serine/threonine protein kinase
VLCVQSIWLIPTSPAPRLPEAEADGEGDESKGGKPKRWSAEFKDFIACALVKDPAKRATAAALLEHPFVKAAASTDAEKLLAPLVERAMCKLAAEEQQRRQSGSKDDGGSGDGEAAAAAAGGAASEAKPEPKAS